MAVDRSQFACWMDQASQGDCEAFGRVADAARAGLYRFALAQGLRRSDAAEAVQETMLRACGQLDQWRPGGNALGWLYGILVNVCREWKRRKAPGGLDPHVLNECTAAAGDAEAGERLAELAAAIARLPGRQAEAVRCRYLRRMSVAETAGAMGCAEGTVKATVHAALENLRSFMTVKI